MDYPANRGIRPRLLVGPDLPDGPVWQEMTTDVSRMTRETSASVPVLGVLSLHWTSPHRPSQGSGLGETAAPHRLSITGARPSRTRPRKMFRDSAAHHLR